MVCDLGFEVVDAEVSVGFAPLDCDKLEFRRDDFLERFAGDECLEIKG